MLSVFTDWYQELSIFLFITCMLAMLDKLGKGLVLRESVVVFYVFTCLLMPVIGYNFYTIENYLANVFVKYMKVPEDVYFEMALPAISVFTLALTWPLNESRGITDYGETLKKTIQRIKGNGVDLQKLGITILITCISLSLLFRLMPAGLRFIGALFLFSSFAGLLYVYFSPKSVLKYWIFAIFAVFIFGNALATGMFTVVAYMGITIFSFFFLGSKVNLFKKIGFVLIAFSFFIVLQNTKAAFRQNTWLSEYEGNKAVLFVQLFAESMQSGSELFNTTEFFPVFIRVNQGFNISMVQARIPSQQPHDNGARLLKVVGASVIPRVLWADKPEAGGKFNMLHYTGIAIWGYSTNVGPLGEAYGSFGNTGASIFMLILGLTIRFAYSRVFIIAKRTPMILFWLPVLFYQLTYSAETDTLQILNSLIKGSFFIWMLTLIRPSWFNKINLQKIRRKIPNGTAYLQKG